MAERKLKITQVRSPIGRERRQRATLVALRLNKLHRTRIVADTPQVRGRIGKVLHLLQVEEIEA